MPLSFILQMAKLPDPFDWLKPRRLRRWTDRQRARDALLHNSRKPKMTPEEARRDHQEMLRFLGLNAVLGIVIGLAVGCCLIGLDIGGLRGLIIRAANPILPLFLVLVPFASLFGGAAAASAILTLPYESKFREEEEDDKSGDDRRSP
ncbi:hypothetical protein [Aliirhizobium smilacinae]|nr:hypothetical protein [Rhizobium smilacinae]